MKTPLEIIKKYNEWDIEVDGNHYAGKRTLIALLDSLKNKWEGEKVSLFGMNSDKDRLEYGGHNSALTQVIQDLETLQDNIKEE